MLRSWSSENSDDGTTIVCVCVVQCGWLIGSPVGSFVRACVRCLPKIRLARWKVHLNGNEMDVNGIYPCFDSAIKHGKLTIVKPFHVYEYVDGRKAFNLVSLAYLPMWIIYVSIAKWMNERINKVCECVRLRLFELVVSSELHKRNESSSNGKEWEN